jgi:hypothetical protein
MWVPDQQQSSTPRFERLRHRQILPHAIPRAEEACPVDDALIRGRDHILEAVRAMDLEEASNLIE